MSIHILVLNYNGLALMQECLPSIWEASQASPVPCKLSVLDNASSDSSEAWLREVLPHVGWIPAKENQILFSYNTVVEALEEETILLLNNDIKVQRDFIAPLWKTLQGTPLAFAASPLHLDFDGHYNGGMNRFGFRLSMPWAGPFYKNSLEESRIAGPTLFTGNGLFYRKKFMELGGFDTLYRPMGWEDTDLCTRAWRRGWPTLYDPSSVIYHKSSASLSKAFKHNKREALGARNAFLWFFSNFASFRLRLRFWLLLPLTLLALLMTGRSNQLRGFFMSLGRLGEALKRRANDKIHDTISDTDLFKLFEGKR